MRDHETIRLLQRIFRASHRHKWREFDLLELLKRLLDGGDFFEGRAIGTTKPGKVARDDAHLPFAAAVQPGDVGLGQQAHPVGIAAKGLGARVCRLLEVTSVDHVQGRTQVQVETQGGELPTQRLPHLRGIFLRPGGADRHRVGQLGKTLQELVLLASVVFLGNTDV